MTRQQDAQPAARSGTGREAGRTTSWLRENVLDVAPQWVELMRSAVAHVGTPARPVAAGPASRGARAPATTPRPDAARRPAGPSASFVPSRHIDAVLALDTPGWGDGAGPRFNSARAAHAPGSEWPPDQWD